MKENILFECIGQGGGNIGEVLTERDYICHFTNTSNYDLNAIGVNETLKYHIPNTYGSSGDIKKAMQYANDYHMHIINTIDGKFPRQDIIFFVFTLGGGTGAGISPLILDYISRMNKNKHYGAIVVLPSLSNSSVTHLNNALQVFTILKQIECLKSVFILDNSTRENVFDINNQFADHFDKLMNISKSDKRGVIDQDEVKNIITSKGLTVMGEFDISTDNEFAFKNSIYAPYKKAKKCEYLGISLAEQTNTQFIEKHFGIAKRPLVGYNDYGSNFAICTGLPLYTSRLGQMSTRIQSLLFDRSVGDEEEEEIEILPLDIYEKKEIKEEKKVNFSDILNKYMK